MIKAFTTSEMRCFKKCRRRWMYEYVQGIKPVKLQKPLLVGTLYHYGVELLMKGTKLDKIEPMLHVKNEQASAPEMPEAVEARLAYLMVQEFDKHSGWRDWEIQTVEAPFECFCGRGRRLSGKIDACVKVDGKTYLLEHKTTSTYGETYETNLLWDEQPTNYLFAYQCLLENGLISGEMPVGVFYCIIQKPPFKRLLATPVDKRKYKADGTLYVNMRDHDETDDEYIARCREWYSADCRLHKTFAIRTNAQLQEQFADIKTVMRDMMLCEKNGTFYRNPDACRIIDCPYRPKCLEDTPDTDVLFVKKQAKHEELQNA